MALGLIVAYGVAHARRYHGAVIDDAFTTFRHAANLVDGYGFTCNPGERIEGTSSPLFGLLMAVPIALRLEPYTVASWLSTVAFAGCVVSAYVAVRIWLDGAGSRWLALGAAAIVASSSTLAFHSQTGLETVAYACAIAWAFCLHLRTRMGRPDSIAWAYVMGIAALLRPEGFAVFLLLFGLKVVDQVILPMLQGRFSVQPEAGSTQRAFVRLLRCPKLLAAEQELRSQEFLAAIRKLRSPELVKAARELGAFAAIWLPWALFRLAYYGKWWPNTVTAKSGHIDLSRGLWSAFADATVHGPGTAQLQKFASENALMLALLLGAIVLPKVRYPILIAVALTLSYAAVTTWNGGDWMPHYRLLTPCITPLAVGSALGLRAFLYHREQQGGFVIAAIALGFVVLSKPQLTLEDQMLKDLPFIRDVGRRLASVRRQDDSVVSAMAGILPYYWGAPTVDMYGLCDSHIAHVGKPLTLGVGRYDAKYLVAKKPTFYAFEFIILAVDFFVSPEFARDRGSYYLVQFPAGYLGSKTFNAPTLLVRKDRPDVQAVATALNAKLVDAEQELRRIGFLDGRHLESPSSATTP